MRTTAAYGDLLRMGRPIVTTAEAATRWRVEEGTARRRLRSIAEAGLGRRLRRGLWTLDPEVDPFVVPPFLTAPLAAYVSFTLSRPRHSPEILVRRHQRARSLPSGVSPAGSRGKDRGTRDHRRLRGEPGWRHLLPPPHGTAKGSISHWSLLGN